MSIAICTTHRCSLRNKCIRYIYNRCIKSCGINQPYVIGEPEPNKGCDLFYDKELYRAEQKKKK